MASFTRKASAQWNGGLKDGNGRISTQSGAVKDVAYSFSQRFEETPGTNPEELVAAAHAGCFSMALSKELATRGMEPKAIRTQAGVRLSNEDGGWSVTGVHLEVEVEATGGDDATLQEAVEAAKAGCPISRLLRAEVTATARLA